MTECLEREAIVTEVAGDRARIHADRPSACAGCGMRGACGSQLLERYRGNEGVWVANTIGAREGESVIVSMPGDALLGQAAIAYLLPLATLLGAALAADALLPPHPLGTATAAAGGLLAGVTIARGWLKRRQPPTSTLTLRRRSGDAP